MKEKNILNMIKIIKGIYKRVNKFLFLKIKGNARYARSLGVKVGSDCRVYINEFGSEPFLVSIGDRVTITAGVKLLTHNGSTWLIRDEQGRRYDYKPVKIGSDVFIGTNSIIMPGVTIGNEVIVAAGSIVTKSIPSGSIVGGNPAKIIGSYSQYKEKMLASKHTEYARDRNSSYRECIMKEVDVVPKPYLKLKDHKN